MADVELGNVSDGKAVEKGLFHPKPASLAFKNLTFEVPHKGGTKKIIDSVSGSVKSGEILFIMGPSGAGKSTMLDCLADRIKGKIEGEIFVNDQARQIKTFKHISAYVQQEDYLYPSLTVKESLLVSTRLYVEDESVHEEIVNEVMTMLGLVEQNDVKVGGPLLRGLSGGQKKRLSIGVEVVSRPSILFLDEPTSGLDSTATWYLVQGLRQLAARGTTIIATIHQPSSQVLNMSDKLLLLSRGRTAYFGPTAGAMAHFEALGHQCDKFCNPADFYLSLINADFHSPEQVGQLLDHFVGSPAQQALQQELGCLHCDEHAAEESNWLEDVTFKTSIWRQTRVLCKRNLLNIIRNPTVIWLRMGMYIALAIFIGTVYLQLDKTEKELQDRISVLFFIAAFMVFMSVSVLPAFLEERLIFVRERANGAYRVSAYSFANFLVSIPFIFLLALVSGVICYWLVGLNSDANRFWFFIFNLFLSLLVAENMMVVVASAIPIFIVSLAGAAALYGWFMLVCGFFRFKDNIGWWWRWSTYLSMHYYSFSNFMDNDLKGLNFSSSTGGVMTGEQVLDRYGISINKWENIAVLVGMAFIYRLISFLILLFFQKGKK